MTMAVFVLGFSSIFTGINFIATVHKLRAPGMGWFDMPLFVWGIYSTAIIQVLATPVLGITLVLLVLERVFNIGIFDPRIGGDPVLFQHFFWFYSHPAVYIMILPGMAIISELIPTFSRKTIFGYRAIAYSSVSLALRQLHRVGPSHVRRRPVAAGHRGLLGADVPGRDSLRRQDVQLAGTMYKGNISLETPMLLRDHLPAPVRHRRPDRHLPGRAVDRRSPDRHLLRRRALPLRDDGRHGDRLHRRPALLVAQDDRPDVLGELGPHRLRAGVRRLQHDVPHRSSSWAAAGMPRRYYNYLDQFQPLHAFSTFGSWMLGPGPVHHAAYLLASLRKPMDAPDNPWGGTTLEWQTSSPPITAQFRRAAGAGARALRLPALAVAHA